VTVPSAVWLPLFLFLLAAMEFNFFWNVFAISAEVLSIAGCYLQATMFEILHVHRFTTEGMFTVDNRRHIHSSQNKDLQFYKTRTNVEN
jgi:hypothetical protein